MEKRRINEKYAGIAANLIETEPLLSHIRAAEPDIIYLSSDNKKTSCGKAILGECEKTSSKNKWAIPADFQIIIYEPNIEGMTEEQIEILIYHELLHIGITNNGGTPSYFINQHDVTEFKDIIDRFGTEWSKV